VHFKRVYIVVLYIPFETLLLFRAERIETQELDVASVVISRIPAAEADAPKDDIGFIAPPSLYGCI